MVKVVFFGRKCRKKNGSAEFSMQIEDSVLPFHFHPKASLKSSAFLSHICSRKGVPSLPGTLSKASSSV